MAESIVTWLQDVPHQNSHYRSSLQSSIWTSAAPNSRKRQRVRADAMADGSSRILDESEEPTPKRVATGRLVLDASTVLSHPRIADFAGPLTAPLTEAAPSRSAGSLIAQSRPTSPVRRLSPTRSSHKTSSPSRTSTSASSPVKRKFDLSLSRPAITYIQKPDGKKLRAAPLAHELFTSIRAAQTISPDVQPYLDSQLDDLLAEVAMPSPKADPNEVTESLLNFVRKINDDAAECIEEELMEDSWSDKIILPLLNFAHNDLHEQKNSVKVLNVYELSASNVGTVADTHPENQSTSIRRLYFRLLLLDLLLAHAAWTILWQSIYRTSKRQERFYVSWKTQACLIVNIHRYEIGQHFVI